MRIFYGAAIQGSKKRGERSQIHKTLISCIKKLRHAIVSEHITGKTKKKTAILLEKSIGPLPPVGLKELNM